MTYVEIADVRATDYRHRGVQEYAPMAPETRLRLTEIFGPHARRLAELLGRELPWARTERGGAVRARSAS